MGPHDESTALVSVVMAAYNAEAFITEAIESVLSQHHSNVELIVIDDGSTDRTNEIISSYIDSRVRLVTHSENMRLAFSLNEGVKLARGQYVARLDADDVCHPARLVKQVRYLERHPEVTVLGGDAVVIGRARGRLRYPRRHEEIKASLLFQNAMNHPTVMFRKDAVPEWYDARVVAGQDYELWARLVWLVKFANLPTPAIGYRFHEGQTSKKLGAHQVATARSARRAMASKLAGSWSDTDWDLYLRGCECVVALELQELSAFEGLLRRLREGNQISQTFAQDELRRAAIDVLARNVGLSLATSTVGLLQLVRSGLLYPVIRRPRLAYWALSSRLRRHDWA